MFDWTLPSSRDGLAVPWTPRPTREMGRAEIANVANQQVRSSRWTTFLFLVSFCRSHFWNGLSSNLTQVKTDTHCSGCLALTFSSFESLASTSKALSSLQCPWRNLRAHKVFKGWQQQYFRVWRVNIIWTSLISWVCEAGLEMLPKQVLYPPCLSPGWNPEKRRNADGGKKKQLKARFWASLSPLGHCSHI